ncbi:MAG: hypothetical protein D3910_05600, partial [Candidatus Electrothrix sp. ATG2]|nr:hypothetical protein [Candidatus Electrothrix sp. ATG2]
MIGISYHLPAPEVIYFPFLDNLSLLHQAPLIYSFWIEGQLVCSSLQDPDFWSRQNIKMEPAYKSGIKLRNTPYILTIHQFPPADIQTEFIPFDKRATELTAALLDKSGQFALPDEFFSSLKIAIESRSMPEFNKPQRKKNLKCID